MEWVVGLQVQRPLGRQAVTLSHPTLCILMISVSPSQIHTEVAQMPSPQARLKGTVLSPFFLKRWRGLFLPNVSEVKNEAMCCAVPWPGDRSVPP